MPNNYSSQVKYAANAAILTAFVLILVKSIAWWYTGSVSMLASITDSLLDLLASFTNMLILRFALMPADNNHAFGHGKAESMAAFAQSAFISGSAIFLLLQGIHRFNHPQALNHSTLGIAATIFAIIATALLISYQGKVISQTGSPAIQADQLHYKTDLFMNITILISLMLGAYGVMWADAIFAIGIALYILFNAVKMQIEAIQMLLDIALPKEEIEQIEQIARETPHIIDLHDLRTRRSGAVRFIQLHLELEDNLSFIEVHDITEHLEQRLLAAFPMSNIIIHPEPTSVVKAEWQIKA